MTVEAVIRPIFKNYYFFSLHDVNSLLKFLHGYVLLVADFLFVDIKAVASSNVQLLLSFR